MGGALIELEDAVASNRFGNVVAEGKVSQSGFGKHFVHRGIEAVFEFGLGSGIDIGLYPAAVFDNAVFVSFAVRDAPIRQVVGLVFGRGGIGRGGAGSGQLAQAS